MIQELNPLYLSPGAQRLNIRKGICKKLFQLQVNKVNLRNRDFWGRMIIRILNYSSKAPFNLVGLV